MKATTVTRGQKFGRWIVGRELPPRKGHRVFECRCECGGVGSVHLSALRSGLSGSCGCLRKEVVTTHGASWKEHQTPEYRTWVEMNRRCRATHRHNSRYYSHQGVKVCRRWRESFDVFLKDMGRRPSLQHSIDRYPDPSGDYKPSNTRWATRFEQTHNRRKRR